MADNLVLRLAQLRVHDFADESAALASRHQDAMECRDCEDFLRRGIEAARFLRIAENIFRDADYRGIAKFDADLQRSIESLYVAWFSSVETAEKWIHNLDLRHYVPDNLAEFRRACEQMHDALEHKTWQSHATSARVSALVEEPW